MKIGENKQNDFEPPGTNKKHFKRNVSSETSKLEK